MDTPRLFFAVWPDKTALRQISSCISTWQIKQGMPVKPANIHITLAFIGAATTEYQRCLERAAENIRASRFDFILDQSGYFAKSHILWLGPDAAGTVALGTLTATLSQALRACGYVPEIRPYTPHVTLYRNAVLSETLLLHKPIRWSVTGFWLAESQRKAQGVHYEKRKYYELSKD